jgi:hypothetical protein
VLNTVGMLSFTGTLGRKTVRPAQNCVTSSPDYLISQAVLLGPDGLLRLIDFGCAVLAYPPSVFLNAASEVSALKAKSKSAADA